MFEDIINSIDTLKDRVREKANEVAARAKEDANKELISEYAIFLQNAHDDAAIEFYNAFPVQYYSRNGSIYNVFTAEENGEAITMITNGNLMTKGRNADLFDLVYLGGSHGGPTYRKPYPYFTYYSRPAEVTTSPRELFVEKRSELEKQYTQDQHNLTLAKFYEYWGQVM